MFSYPLILLLSLSISLRRPGSAKLFGRAPVSVPRIVARPASAAGPPREEEEAGASAAVPCSQSRIRAVACQVPNAASRPAHEQAQEYVQEHAHEHAQEHVGGDAARSMYVGTETERGGRQGVVWSIGAVGLLENEDKDRDWEYEAWDRSDAAGVGPQGEWVQGQARETAEALGALSLMSGGVDCRGDDSCHHVPAAKGRIR